MKHNLSVGAKWVRMHLLTELLGGPAMDSNLTPARGPESNQRFKNSVEHPAKGAVDAGQVIWYKVDIDYHGSPNENYVNLIRMEWGPYNFENEKWEEKDAGFKINGKSIGGSDSQSPGPPDFSGGPEILNINDKGVGRVRIEAFDDALDRQFAEFVIAVRENLPYGFRSKNPS